MVEHTNLGGGDMPSEQDYDRATEILFLKAVEIIKRKKAEQKAALEEVKSCGQEPERS